MKHPHRNRARSLRRNQTDAELRLWLCLRNRRLAGWKFKRQHPVGRYIADFACVEAQIIVEADGSQHAANADDDARRTAYLESRGWVVLRFWNNDILQRTESVLEVIAAALRTAEIRKSAPSPPHPGG